MNAKDLKWFQEVCRCKSMTKAAANLYISPQGLSKAEVLLQELNQLTQELERMKQMENGFLRLCSAYGILRILSPDIIFNTSGFSLCHKLCRQKKGLSIVVDRISQDMNDSHLRKIPFETPLVWKAAMVYKKKFAQNGLIRTFHEYTLDYLREQGIS